MEITSPTADEFAFVFDSWANSFRKSPWAGCIPNNLYDQVSRATMTNILDRGARVLVAVTPIDGHEGRRVMGYSVFEPERRTLHWVFVKRDFRGVGVGRTLLAATCPGDDRWSYTHRTRASAKYLGPRFVWDATSARTK